VTSPQILRGEGQQKKTDNKKQRVHLGNGRGIQTGIAIAEVRI